MYYLQLSYPLQFLVGMGMGGVDIFIFLSGYGLTYGSFEKNLNTAQFYFRRIQRIFPGYLIATVASLFVLNFFIGNKISYAHAFFKLSTLWFWAKKGLFLWFIPAILAMYLMFPFYMKVFRKSKDKFIFTLYAMLIIYSLCGILWFCGNGFYLIFFARIPVFMLGIWIGYKHIIHSKYNESQTLAFHILMVCVVVACLVLIRTHMSIKTQQLTGLRFYPFIFFTYSFLSILATLFDLINIQKIRIFQIAISMLNFTGTHSLEIYLLHGSIVFPLGNFYFDKGLVNSSFLRLLNYGNFLRCTIYFIVTVLFAWILKKICDKIINFRQIVSRRIVEAH